MEGVGGAAVDGGLGLGGAGQFAEDLASLLLDFCEGGFGLIIMVSILTFVSV